MLLLAGACTDPPGNPVESREVDTPRPTPPEVSDGEEPEPAGSAGSGVGGSGAGGEGDGVAGQGASAGMGSSSDGPAGTAGVATTSHDAGGPSPRDAEVPSDANDPCADLDEDSCSTELGCTSVEDVGENYRGCRSGTAACDAVPTCAVLSDIYSEWAWFPDDCVPPRWVTVEASQCGECSRLVLLCAETVGCVPIHDVDGAQRGCRDDALVCADVETCAQGPEYDLALYPTSCIPVTWSRSDLCDDTTRLD